jgi:hypothetical protein
MKPIILFLLAAFSLAACSNYGKKIKVEGTKGEVYYKGDGVTESDAKKTGEFLKKQGYFSADKGASVQLRKEADAYVISFVYNKKVYDTLKIADNLFKILGAQASKEVFDGKKVNIALTNDHFKEYKSIPYDEATAKSLEPPVSDAATFNLNGFDHSSAGDVDFYWKGISDEESKTIADYIIKNGSFSGGTAELYMTKEGDRYIIRFPMIESARTDPSALATVETVSKDIKDNMFPNVPFSFFVTDEQLNTVKSWDY